MNIIIACLEMVGTISFAFSGAVVGVKKRMDLFGIMMLGIVTATCGGVFRDIILGLTPPDAFRNPKNVMVAALVSWIVFLPPVRRWVLGNHIRFEKLLLLADSAGLGIFTVYGARVAIFAGYGYSWFLVIFVGVLTGVGGGIFRDLLSGEPPYIFAKHIYACASIVGAFTFVCLWEAEQSIAILAGTAVVLLIRLLSAKYHWELPKA